jgi:thioredoxin-like negative regulator of GroEL
MSDPKTSNLEFRHRQTLRYGARTLDQIFAELACKECGTPIPDPAVRPVELVDYGTLAELQESATRACKGVTPPALSCVSCQGKPKVVHLDYHTFSSGLARDLVVRCVVKGGLLGGFKTELWTWGLDRGYQQLADPPPPELTQRFGRDAAVRGAWTEIETKGVRQALPKIEQVVGQLAGHKVLLEFIAPLLSAGKAALAARIAQAHVDSWPNDPQGHYWLAEILIQAIVHGVVNSARLDEAQRLLDRALSVDPTHGPSLCARANLPRLRGDTDAAYAALSDLVRERPDLADAHYHLGVMALDRAPAKALEHFARAEAAGPETGDYPLGRARALARLGRAEEARQALARARELAPEHPRLKEVEALIR